MFPCFRLLITARYGAAKSSQVLSIQRCLATADPHLVGVFAQLVYIEDTALCEVVSAAYCSAMQV